MGKVIDMRTAEQIEEDESWGNIMRMARILAAADGADWTAMSRQEKMRHVSRVVRLMHPPASEPSDA